MHDSQWATKIRTCSAVLFSRVMDVTSMSKKPFLRIRSSSSSVFRTARLAHRKPQYDTTTYVNGSSMVVALGSQPSRTGAGRRHCRAGATPSVTADTPAYPA